MDAPQSPAEIEPIERKLRLMDDLLRIRWNPRSYVTRPGHFDAHGLAIPPAHEGRWEVIRLAADPPILVYQVKHEDSEGYKPIGEWLVQYMELLDRQNTHWMADLKKRYEEEERLEAHANQLADDVMRENVERTAINDFKHKHLLGKGFGPGLRG